MIWCQEVSRGSSVSRRTCWSGRGRGRGWLVSSRTWGSPASAGQRTPSYERCPPLYSQVAEGCEASGTVQWKICDGRGQSGDQWEGCIVTTDQWEDRMCRWRVTAASGWWRLTLDWMMASGNAGWPLAMSASRTVWCQPQPGSQWWVSHDNDDDSDLIMRPLCAVAPAEIVIMAAEEEINETLTVTGKDISQ